MDVVAVYALRGSAEDLARDLAGALGVTAYEARPRVNVPGGGPAVVASFAASAQAQECAARLQDAGFKTLVLQPDQMETDANRLLVRQIDFHPHTLEFTSHTGRQIDLPYCDVYLLLRGAGIITQVEVEQSTKKKFSPGRAVATGGLMMRKKVKTVTTNTTQERQPFCHVYAPEHPPIRPIWTTPASGRICNSVRMRTSIGSVPNCAGAAPPRAGMSVCRPAPDSRRY